MTEVDVKTQALSAQDFEVESERVGLRVLHIEDNPSDAELMQEHLRGILPSVTFDSALRLAEVTPERASAADCALLDLSLPDASGLDALITLREMSDRLPIIVLTGFDDMELGLGAVRDGADDYLVKNHVDGYTLERAVQYAIERRHLLLELDTSIAETIVAEASSITVAAAMTAALRLGQQVDPDDPPAATEGPTTDVQQVWARLDRDARALQRKLELESRQPRDRRSTPGSGRPTNTVKDTLAELGLIVAADQQRNATLLRIVQLAARVIPGLVDVSVTMPDEFGGRTVVFTGPLAVELDDRQHEVGVGPSIDAAATLSAVSVVTGEENPYPHFSLAARRAEITHCLAIGIPVPNRIAGALNLYATSGQLIKPDTIVLAECFANYAAVSLAQVTNGGDPAEQAAQLQDAIKTRRTIERAVGILMAQNHCAGPAAIETLAFLAQNQERPILDIASALVDTIG